MTDRLVTEKPAISKPVTEESATNRLATEESATNRLATEEPTTNRPERIEFENKQQIKVPFEHYLDLYEKSDPAEISLRTGLEFNKSNSSFALKLMGTPYDISFPDFIVKDSEGEIMRNAYEEILLIRYLLEGSFVPPSEKNLAYEEMPWGTVYYSNFKGRVVGRILGQFGKDINSFRKTITSMPGLRYEEVPKCDVGYRFEYINNLFITIMLWEGDDEFPASAQLLFSDNFKYAFTAEDIAVVGDSVNGRLKVTKGKIAAIYDD